MTKSEKLHELKNRIEAEKPAPKLGAQASQLVFGTGSSDAAVLFVGEAPGKQEDISGKPFVGASGRMLDELLTSIKLERKDIYITNIVKYRPPNNRDPHTAEKKAFWPYLLEQIAIIKPRVIATLGRHSGQAFLPDLDIGRDHGQPQTVQLMFENKETSVTVLPLYHPAAALYNGSLRTTLLKDFQQVRQYL